MAKIKKIIEEGSIQYPATITDAVVNPNNRKTVTEELSELGQEVDGIKMQIEGVDFEYTIDKELLPNANNLVVLDEFLKSGRRYKITNMLSVESGQLGHSVIFKVFPNEVTDANNAVFQRVPEDGALNDGDSSEFVSMYNTSKIGIYTGNGYSEVKIKIQEIPEQTSINKRLEKLEGKVINDASDILYIKGKTTEERNTVSDVIGNILDEIEDVKNTTFVISDCVDKYWMELNIGQTPILRSDISAAYIKFECSLGDTIVLTTTSVPSSYLFALGFLDENQVVISIEDKYNKYDSSEFQVPEKAKYAICQIYNMYDKSSFSVEHISNISLIKKNSDKIKEIGCIIEKSELIIERLASDASSELREFVPFKIVKGLQYKIYNLMDKGSCLVKFSADGETFIENEIGETISYTFNSENPYVENHRISFVAEFDAEYLYVYGSVGSNVNLKIESLIKDVSDIYTVYNKSKNLEESIKNILFMQPLKTGGTISVLGDSISSFGQREYSYYYDDSRKACQYPASDISYVEQTYWYKIMSRQCCAIGTNMSFSGSCATKGLTSLPTLYERASIIGNPDICIVALGTNDSNGNAELGDYDYESTIDSLNEMTFIGAYTKGIKKLIENNERMQIICVCFNMQNKYAEAIRNIAEHYGLFYINCSQRYESYDGTHPNSKGMEDIYQIINEYLTLYKIKQLVGA